jgi:hypothetical protein
MAGRKSFSSAKTQVGGALRFGCQPARADAEECAYKPSRLENSNEFSQHTISKILPNSKRRVALPLRSLRSRSVDVSSLSTLRRYIRAYMHQIQTSTPSFSPPSQIHFRQCSRELIQEGALGCCRRRDSRAGSEPEVFKILFCSPNPGSYIRRKRTFCGIRIGPPKQEEHLRFSKRAPGRRDNVCSRFSHSF